MPVVEGHSVVAHFAVPFSEERLRAWCERAREALAGEVQLALVFAGARCRRNLGDIVEVVYEDQRTGGSQWNALGTFQFTAGWNRVMLSRWGNGGVVIADAIRIE